MRKPDTEVTRWKKDVKPTPYDPMVAQNAAANTALAQRSQEFSEKYYTDTVAPLVRQMAAASKVESANQSKLFNLNYGQARDAADRYKQYGLPAESRYYDMVSSYSQRGEEERQAGLALGDVRVGAGNANEQLMRRFASMGINPTSPAAIAAMSGRATTNAAAEASAMNRARAGARELGMKLKSDAANFGRGGQSGILQFGAGAGANSTGAFGIASGAVGAGNAGAAVPMAGYGQAMQGYQANMNAYAGMASTHMSQQAQMGGGLGSALGSVAGLAGSFMTSDRRLKRDIVRVGTHSTGLDIYEFNYVWGGERQRGFMADEVEKIMPAAVIYMPDGYAVVNYSMLGVTANV